MGFIVIEIQKNGSTAAVVPPLVFSTELEAQAKFHEILSIAALSSVECHSAVILNDEGFPIRHERYRHPVVDNTIPDVVEEIEEENP